MNGNGNANGHSNVTEGDELDRYLTRNVLDQFLLKDNVVVITGGGRGIGLALAFAVAEAGGLVAIVDALPEPHEHYTKLLKISPKSKFYQSDVTDFNRLKGTFDNIVADFGRIDGLVTAAGVCFDNRFLDKTPDSVVRTFSINVFGTFFATQLAVAQMVRQPRKPNASGAGSIVMIASVAAHQSSNHQFTSDYCSSKGAVVSLKSQLAVELSKDGIRVNCISPGYINTDTLVNYGKLHPKVAEVAVTEPPFHRMGDRSELKGAAVYLLSEASSYTSGSEMLVTGALHVGRYWDGS
ncbi:hypothetical protein AYO21_03044 [Fonsecaea monophora]|uniref:Uncharacterized protein n=1 Tax=Fonsecaea monophora TaxID=254056 RepID=A0A177FGB2_9EURO|nr:hypothetical protein AYO21_03044 [Fonsecaea monophora]OAG42761.1 hypothetical protein AYO21_03044 [Fonsecaea monophora]